MSCFCVFFYIGGILTKHLWWKHNNWNFPAPTPAWKVFIMSYFHVSSSPFDSCALEQGCVQKLQDSRNLELLINVLWCFPVTLCRLNPHSQGDGSLLHLNQQGTSCSNEEHLCLCMRLCKPFISWTSAPLDIHQPPPPVGAGSHSSLRSEGDWKHRQRVQVGSRNICWLHRSRWVFPLKWEKSLKDDASVQMLCVFLWFFVNKLRVDVVSLSQIGDFQMFSAWNSKIEHEVLHKLIVKNISVRKCFCTDSWVKSGSGLQNVQPYDPVVYFMLWSFLNLNICMICTIFCFYDFPWKKFKSLMKTETILTHSDAKTSFWIIQPKPFKLCPF